MTDRIDRITVPVSTLPPQIRIGEEPVAEKFTPATGVDGVLPTMGLWTTSLGRHGPLWHLHLPRESDRQPWWLVEPRSGSRVACLAGPDDLDRLVPDGFADSYTVPWGTLTEHVDGVWLTEQGWERLRDAVDTWNHPTRSVVQMHRYAAFERWASGCVLWLRWCFETVDLYRHGRAEALFTSPFSRCR